MFSHPTTAQLPFPSFLRCLLSSRLVASLPPVAAPPKKPLEKPWVPTPPSPCCAASACVRWGGRRRPSPARPLRWRRSPTSPTPTAPPSSAATPSRRIRATRTIWGAQRSAATRRPWSGWSARCGRSTTRRSPSRQGARAIVLPNWGHPLLTTFMFWSGAGVSADAEAGGHAPRGAGG